jgi:cysteine synthase A
MLPDTGERYLSTPLFADIAAEMDDAEWAISRSSPRARFDAPPSTPPVAVAPPVPAPEALAFLEAAVADASRPALMFGLRWCEFGWALRRLFERIGAPLHEVHVDDPALQADGLAGALRATLAARCGSVTLPQLFVGGRHVGGCTDAIDAWHDGRLPRLLQRAEVPFDAEAQVDPRALLPAWVQPR